MTYNEIMDAIIEYQYNLNQSIHSEWETQNFPWWRAIWLECAELLESLDWKWWNQKEIDLDNAKLEAIDILHFLVSWAIKEGYQTSLNCLGKFVYNMFDKNMVITILEKLASAALQKNYTKTLIETKYLFTYLNLDIIQIAKIYFGKNTLNRFRQLHGLKEGTYSRYWNGVEDNKVMLKIVEDIVWTNPDDFCYEVEKQLKKKYFNINL